MNDKSQHEMGRQAGFKSTTSFWG